MAIADAFQSRFMRFYAVVSDQYGIDPLLDKVVPGLAKITSYSVHTVSQEESVAPDLIALRYYNNDKFWWHILAYNGIGSFRGLTAGTTLRIPDYSDLIAISYAGDLQGDGKIKSVTI